MVPKRLLRYALALLLLLGAPSLTLAQSSGKKALDHDSYDIWKSIRGQILSENGEWLVYTLAPGEGDGTLMARNLRDGSEFAIPGGTGGKITSDSRFLVFTIEPMINLGKKELKILDDNWTAVTKDGALSAQFEQTVLVTENSVESLTPYE
jgi:hypothetical protein